jgi:hypothetical protein
VVVPGVHFGVGGEGADGPVGVGDFARDPQLVLAGLQQQGGESCNQYPGRVSKIVCLQIPVTAVYTREHD